MNANASPRLLDKKQIASEIGVSPRHINVMMAARQIPFLRISAKMVRFDPERVKQALATFEVPAVR